MSGFRRILAVRCAKLTGWLIRKLHRGNGASLPGYIAGFLCPEILSSLSGMVREKVIVTMGTNGKTTTNRLLCHALEAQGKKVLCNRTGANMRGGILSAFIQAAGPDGRLDADYACIEVDEMEAVHLFPQLKPDCVVLTNISRDQLDRYGEVDTIRDKIKAALLLTPKAVLAVNCDDHLSYSLLFECPNPAFTYGIDQEIFDATPLNPGSRESIFCSLCGNKLDYSLIHYGHLGIYRCPACGFSRPLPEFTVSQITRKASPEGISYSFIIEGKGLGEIFADTSTDAPYNVYNTLSACAALCILDAPREHLEEALRSFDYGNGRENTFYIGNARIRLHLAKNPVGFQQKLSLLLKDPAPKDIIFQINDKAQDGKDVSYLWDIDFQCLAAASPASITLVGSRCHDLGLRLKYENIPCCFGDNIEETLRSHIRQGTGNLYVIVNYSGLSDANRVLRELQERRTL